jgi:hypothetical protein
MPRVTYAFTVWTLASMLQSCGHSQTSAPAALITFALCGDSSAGVQTLTVRTTNGAFIDEAERQLSGGVRRVPVFDLVDGPGPDAQWSWHVDDTTPRFADFTVEVCDGCPRTVEANKALWLSSILRYCPATAFVTRVTRFAE